MVGKILEKDLRQIVKNNLILLLYMEKYNIPSNDQRILELTELDMLADIKIGNYLQKHREDIFYEDDYDEEELEDWFNDDSEIDN